MIGVEVREGYYLVTLPTCVLVLTKGEFIQALRRGDGIHLSDENVDRLEPWPTSVAWWRSTRPRPATGESPRHERRRGTVALAT